MTLRVSTRKIGEAVVVDCRGRLVFGDESSAIRDLVKDLLLTEKNIVVNLGEVSYIDSGGLGTLVGLYTSARNSGATIKLANLQRRITELLQITKLLTVFEVYGSEQEAVQSFGSQGAVA